MCGIIGYVGADPCAQLLLDGLSKQADLKRLSYSYNTFGPLSLAALRDKILCKTAPFHLAELRLAHCTVKPGVLRDLLTSLAEHSYLSTLHLVNVPLSDKQAFESLCESCKSPYTHNTAP